jgi:hypothetical protein
MATFVPFAILRLIPAIEAGAVGHLDGLRQRGTATASAPVRTAARHALHAGLTAAGDARHMAQAAAGALGGASSGSAGGSALGSGSSSESEGGGDETEATPENGGIIPGADGMGKGDPNSQRIWDESMAEGLELPPRGPKPTVGWTGGDDDAAPSDSAGAAGATAGTAGTAAGGSTVGPLAPTQLPAPPTRRPRPPERPPTGPATPADAWKWEGVPPGRGFMHPVEPGKHRFYIDYDEHGPKMVGLGPVWPPDEEEAGK